MFKNINWQAIFIGFAWFFSLSSVIVLMSFIEIKKVESTCEKVEVVLPGNQFFIEQAEIDEILKSKNGLLIGRRLSGIDIQYLENKLKANPFIEYAKVYIDMNGIIHADVKQRVPVLRILNLSGQDFYVDQNGYKIPLSDHFTARVLVANGIILEDFSGKVDTLKTKLSKDLFLAAKYIAEDSLWNDQIVQMFVNEKNDIELIPRVGNQKIILGNADNLKDKFRNLLLFYKKAIPQAGWDTYSSINLKFKGQIVCEKRDSTLLLKPILKADSIVSLKTNSTEIQDSTKNIL